MPATILASLTGLASDRSVLEAAVAAARIDGGHIQCLRARIDVVESAALAAASANRQADYYEAIRKIEDEEETRSRHARAAFDEACKRHALPVHDRPQGAPQTSIAWKETRSVLNETLTEARYHDLTIMGRDENLSRERIVSVLMRSGRPLLLAPQKPVDIVGRRIAIAWKESAEAARALTAAAPLLSRADSVTILAIAGHASDGDGTRLSAEHLANRLAWRGIKTDIRISESPQPSTSKALLDMAYEQDVDLLVMGAYGHSRVREFVFGGVTRDLLAACPLPLFMVG
jgi:nucleotide-binding universal stress UspA family protein